MSKEATKTAKPKENKPAEAAKVTTEVKTETATAVVEREIPYKQPPTPAPAPVKKKKKNKISRRENNWHGWLFIGPYALIFSIFILIPVILAVILSFTNFNAIQFPKFVGFLNYITILTNDEVFMKYVLPNTVVYAVVVGTSSRSCWHGPSVT